MLYFRGSGVEPLDSMSAENLLNSSISGWETTLYEVDTVIY